MSNQKPGHLLIVDDNKVNRIMLSHAVENLGHSIDIAENGLQALDKLRGGSFDLVLLDIEMPELDGYKVLETCLKDTELRNIPIIMTSSLDELDSVVKCIELGAEDYLNKPVNPILLRARINASLEKKHLRDEQRKLLRTFTTREVAEELLKSGFSLGGKSVNASVMFADIRSFTTITEASDPAQIIEMLNDYFALMFDAITKHGGTVNQIIGDGLMALFGTPVTYEDHCERAVLTAIEMKNMLSLFNEHRERQGKPKIKIGIGIASGNVIAGFTGTEHRATYTCVGDTVNLAQRIEQHTKVAGKPILIDSETRKKLPEKIKTKDLGSATFKGKIQAINIFSVED